MATNYNPRVVTNGLVFCLDAANLKSYPGSGTTWFSLVGSNNGSLTNGPTFSTTNSGSIVFDGTDDYVAATAALSDSFLQANWSICFWVNFDTLSGPTDGTNDKTLVHHGSPALRGGLHLAQRNTRLLLGLYSDDLSGVQTLSTNTWYNIVFTLDNSTRIRQIYINGRLDASGTGGGAYTGSGNNARICGPILGFGLHFDGFMPHFSTYNRVLTASEISQNFNATRGRFGI